MKKKLLCACVFAMGLLLTACGGDDDNPFQQQPFFTVTTAVTVAGVNQNEGNVPIDGFAAPPASFNCGQNPGGISAFGAAFGTPTFTNQNGVFRLQNPATGCFWHFTRFPSQQCSVLSSKDDFMNSGSNSVLHCSVAVPTFSASPQTINLQARPATFQINGGGMDTTFGMPRVRIYNQQASALAETVASASGGTWIQVPTNFLASLYTDVYSAVVFKVQSNGSLQAVGGVELDLYGNDPPPPPPPPDCRRPPRPMICE